MLRPSPDLSAMPQRNLEQDCSLSTGGTTIGEKTAHDAHSSPIGEPLSQPFTPYRSSTIALPPILPLTSYRRANRSSPIPLHPSLTT